MHYVKLKTIHGKKCLMLLYDFLKVTFLISSQKKTIKLLIKTHYVLKISLVKEKD